MGNWETDFKLFKTKHFEFPSGVQGFMVSESTCAASRMDGPGQAEILPVTRIYQPEPADLKALVDVLYQLLLTNSSDESASPDFNLLPCGTGVTNVSPALPGNLGGGR